MTRKNIIIFIIIAGLVLIFWSSTLLQDYFQKASVFLQNYGDINPYLSILIFVGLSTLSAMLFSFSSIWLVPIAAVLWSNPTTVVLLLLSWLIGAVFSYLIGRYGGYPIIKKFIPEKKILYYENLITNRLNIWVIFLFRLMLPSEIPGYLLGIIRYPFGKYFLITFLSEIPYAIYTVYAVDSILERKPVMLAVLTAVWLSGAWLLIYLYRKQVDEKNSK